MKRKRERSKPWQQPSGARRYGFCERGFWHGDEMGNMRKDGTLSGMQLSGGGVWCVG